MRAALFSRHLDVRDLQALGAPPAHRSLQRRQRRRGKTPRQRLLWHLALTRGVDAQLHFEGQTVLMANQTLHNVSTDLALHDGHLTLTPMFHLAGGTTRARIDLEDRGEALPHLAVRAEMAQVNVQQVFDALGLEDKAAGRVDGHMDLTASGRSLPQLVSSLAGKAAFTVKDQARHTDFHVQVATEGGAQLTPSRLRLTGQGRVYGEPFHLEGRVGAWGSGQQPSAVQVQLRLGGNARPDERHPWPGATAGWLDGPRCHSGVRPRAALCLPAPRHPLPATLPPGRSLAAQRYRMDAQGLQGLDRRQRPRRRTLTRHRW